MSHGDLQGWSADPFGRHEQRYFSAGQPTKLVRDGLAESYDEPPPVSAEWSAPQAEPGPGAAVSASAGAVWPAAASGEQGVPSPEPAAARTEQSAPSPEPAAAGGPGRPRFAVLYTVAVVAVLAVVAAVALILRGTSGQTTLTGAAFVTRAAQHTAAQRTVDVTLAGTVRGGGQSVTIRGAGGINLSTGSSELTLLMTIDGHRVVEKEIQLPGAAYFTLSLDGKNLPRQLGDRDWIRIPVQSATAAIASGSSPQAALRLLEQHGSAVHELGQKTIGGTQCTGYSVTPGHQAMLAAARQVSAGGALPPGVAATLQGITPPTFTVWLDGRGLVRQMTASLQVGDLPDASSGAAAQVVETFSGYGTPVQIVAPAAADVQSEQTFLRRRGGAGSV
jgi:hypothetical protein